MRYTLQFLVLFCLVNISFSQENTITIKTSELLNDEDEFEFDIIEQVPVYKGCDEKLANIDLRKCMSDAINQHVSSNFNRNIANGLGFSGFKVKIYARFSIDKDGTITNIKARGPHPKFEEEAKRVIKLIPTLDKPGIQDKKTVMVTFDLPISFNLENKQKGKTNTNSIKDLDSFPIHKRCNETLGLNSQRECTTKKIMDFVQLSVNTQLAAKLFPQNKTTKFQLNFIIDKKGKIKKER